MDDAPEDMARFKVYLPIKEGLETGLIVTYRRVEIMASWHDEDKQDLIDVIATFPKILDMAEQEALIAREARNIQVELDELLEGDE